MLSAAITVLFALSGIIAAASVLHSLREARVTWGRITKEGDPMCVGYVAQAAVDMSLRPAMPRARATHGMPTQGRRLRSVQLQPCAAA